MAEDKLLLALRGYWPQLILIYVEYNFIPRLTLGAACTGGALISLDSETKKRSYITYSF
jgi:hypothetical protein